jgi:hypothetical protein
MWLLRQTIFVGLMFMVYGAVYLEAMGGDTPGGPSDSGSMAIPETMEARIARLQQVGKFNEGGLVESLEFSLLLSLVISCGWVAYRHPEVQAVSFLMVGAFGLAAIREQDAWFDAFAHGCWVVPAGLLATAMAVFFWIKRSDIMPELARMVTTSGWGFFVSGGLMAMVFARLMGQKGIWNYLIDSPRLARNMKNMSEESIETAGYALLLCGLIEGCAHLRNRQSQEHQSVGVG